MRCDEAFILLWFPGIRYYGKRENIPQVDVIVNRISSEPIGQESNVETI